MYVIKSWTRDFRDDQTRRNDWSCYREYDEVNIGDLGFIPVKKKVGKSGTFIEGRIIHAYPFKRRGIRFILRYIECILCEDFTEVAYIPDTFSEYDLLNSISDKVIRGDYGNYPDRKSSLERDGYNYMKVQSFVNYKLGSYDLFDRCDFENIVR